ncbi:hypothetical protein ZWY2020_042013 [Hordeum vulgare]|nr:hypothetical protein ZWY2020_042013 [Hordeum vulgare]
MGAARADISRGCEEPYRPRAEAHERWWCLRKPSPSFIMGMSELCCCRFACSAWAERPCYCPRPPPKPDSGLHDLIAAAGRTLKANITTLAPIVLPISEQVLLAVSFMAQKLSSGRFKVYVPNFLTAFEHFCIHAGGSAIIDEVQRSLSLLDEHVEPSRLPRHRCGNTSSSSTWYELAYIEAKGRMRRGDRVWMIGFGSGFKCNSVVEVHRSGPNTNGPWAGCIHRYPVQIKSPKTSTKNIRMAGHKTHNNK